MLFRHRFKQLGRVSTFHFQASLPRLPLPKLKETCQQYLTAQKGLLSPEEFAVTSQLTKEFSLKGSEGWSKEELYVLEMFTFKMTYTVVHFCVHYYDHEVMPVCKHSS